MGGGTDSMTAPEMHTPFIIGLFLAHEETLANAVQGLQVAKTAGCDAFAVCYWSSGARMRTRRQIEEPSTAHDLGSVRAGWLSYLKNGCAGLNLLFGIEVALPEDVPVVVAPNVDFFMVGSYEARDRELLRAIAAARGERPVFVATGLQEGRDMDTMPKDAIRMHTVEAVGACPIEQVNLGAIELHEGFLDSTRVIFAGGLAVMAGADYLALPYRLAQTGASCPGVVRTLNPDELTKAVYFERTAAVARGSGERVIQPCEREQMRYRVVR